MEKGGIQRGRVRLSATIATILLLHPLCLAEVTNFDALMNAGLNVPRLINLADHGARKAKEKRRAT